LHPGRQWATRLKGKSDISGIDKEIAAHLNRMKLRA
jgi:hypothetical protein